MLVGTPLKRTPLHDAHVKAGARMVEFGGWDMPVQYRGILEEHRTVRSAVGLFDVSHMGEFEVEGPGALAVLQRLTTNDVAALEVGQVHYSLLCHPHGGSVDDLAQLSDNALRARAMMTALAKLAVVCLKYLRTGEDPARRLGEWVDALHRAGRAGGPTQDSLAFATPAIR